MPFRFQISFFLPFKVRGSTLYFLTSLPFGSFAASEGIAKSGT
jgi:hypothetical protein